MHKERTSAVATVQSQVPFMVHIKTLSEHLAGPSMHFDGKVNKREWKKNKNNNKRLFYLSAIHLICVLGEGSSGWSFEMMYQCCFFFSISCPVLVVCLFREPILMRYYLMSCYFITWIRIARDVWEHMCLIVWLWFGLGNVKFYVMTMK